MGAEKKISDETEVIAYIVEYREENGMPPSVREIAERFGVAHGTAGNVLQRLFDEGLLRRSPGVARGLTISEAGMKMITEVL